MTPLTKADQIKQTKKKKKSGSERKKLIKECDRLIREITFLKEDRCFVTGVEAGRWNPQTNPNGLQLSHFVTRTVFPLRWDFMNCHLTTAGVNYAHENNALPYTLAMIEKYQNEGLQRLQDIHDEYKKRAKTMTTVEIRAKKVELEELLAKYKL